MKIPKNRLIGTLFASALLGLTITRLQAQLPFQLPASMVLETVTESNLLQQYPDRPELSNNVTEIKKYLSIDSPYSMRLSTSTETAISRQMVAQQIKQFGTANTNLHFHINFSLSHFLVEELNCPPNSYPLDVWQPVNNEAKIRSDGFFDGKYFVMMPRGELSEMEFDNLGAFKKACIDAMQNLQPPSTHNGLLEQACVDFRQFARFQNLGHEGVVPNSFTFSNNDFVCLGVRGDHISGSIYTNADGLVDEIYYKSSEHYGSRDFLLFYETLFTNCTWYPSRIVDATKQGDNLHAIKSIHTVYNVYAEEKGDLVIPNTTAELYGTNIARTFEWSNNMAYESVGTQLVARPTLVQRRSESSPRTRNLFGVFFIGFLVISLVVIIYFSRKKKINKGQTYMKTNTSAPKRATSALMMAVVTFCLVGLALLAAIFGVSYLALCGPNLVHFSDWPSYNLWQILFEKGCRTAIAAFAVAIAVYYISSSRRSQDETSKAAA